MKKLILIFIFICSSVSYLQAQTAAPFYDDVQTIRKFDRIYKAPEHPILFVGSSSVRKWDNLIQDFEGYKVLNRGIGGTVIEDITFYLNDLVFPYKPKQIVLYVGENNLSKLSADSIFNLTKVLFSKIREKLPETPIVYISIKPSPVRSQFIAKAAESNRLIKDFLTEDKNVQYLDVYSLMLTKEGKTRPELFVEDMLHLNEKGYAIWTKALKPYLLKN